MAKFKIKYSIQEFEHLDDGSSFFRDQWDRVEKDYNIESLKSKISKLVFEYDERIIDIQRVLQSENILEKYRDYNFEEFYKILTTSESSFKIIFEDIFYKKEICMSKKEVDEYVLNLTNEFFLKNKEKIKLKYVEYNKNKIKSVIFDSLKSIEQVFNKLNNSHKQEVESIQIYINEIKKITNNINII